MLINIRLKPKVIWSIRICGGEALIQRNVRKVLQFWPLEVRNSPIVIRYVRISQLFIMAVSQIRRELAGSLRISVRANIYGRCRLLRVPLFVLDEACVDGNHLVRCEVVLLHVPPHDLIVIWWIQSFLIVLCVWIGRVLIDACFCKIILHKFRHHVGWFLLSYKFYRMYFKILLFWDCISVYNIIKAKYILSL